jgi:hypothetical protein
MEAESHVTRTTLGGDGFEERLGVGLAARRSLSTATVLSLNVVHDEVDGAESQFDYLEGARNQVGASIDRHGPNGRLTFAYQLEANDRASASVAPTRNRFSARYRYTAGTHWDADFRLSFRTSDYDELAMPRGEDLAELWLGFGRNFARGLRVYGAYQGSENDSDDELFSYTRSRIGLGLSKTF